MAASESTTDRHVITQVSGRNALVKTLTRAGLLDIESANNLLSLANSYGFAAVSGTSPHIGRTLSSYQIPQSLFIERLSAKDDFVRADNGNSAAAARLAADLTMLQSASTSALLNVNLYATRPFKTDQIKATAIAVNTGFIPTLRSTAYSRSSQRQVGNGDIGFVREGQEVAVKLDAFPFARYGLLKGHVRKLGRDAVQTGQVAGTGPTTSAQQSAAGVAAPAGAAELRYPAKITLDQDWIGAAGKHKPVQAGMRVSAEIKTGDRKALD